MPSPVENKGRPEGRPCVAVMRRDVSPFPHRRNPVPGLDKRLLRVGDHDTIRDNGLCVERKAIYDKVWPLVAALDDMAVIATGRGDRLRACALPRDVAGDACLW